MKQAVIDKKMAVKIRMVVQLTPQERTEADPLLCDCGSKFEVMRTLSTERLGKKLGRVTPEVLNQIVDGLNEIIG